MKTWYSAMLLFTAHVDGAQVDEPLFEQSIRLIHADDEGQARIAAEALGAREEQKYENEAGETVRWRFVEVLEVQDLCETEVFDGMEVFSRLYRAE